MKENFFEKPTIEIFKFQKSDIVSTSMGIKLPDLDFEEDEEGYFNN